MQYIKRHLEEVCLKDLESFPILTITGPRQSGKSTLLRHLLPDWQYVNLEEPATLDFALADPRGFVNTYSNHVIFDEIQRAPELLSQLQVEVDKNRVPGRFALTGSHNLLLMEKVSQSLAGRTVVRHLLPFGYSELNEAQAAPSSLNQVLFLGGYPLIHAHPASGSAWLDSYIQTYVERDVRLIRNVTDLGSFRRFLLLCAGRSAQLVDMTGLGSDAGVTHNTAKDWISILETGFLVFQLTPYFNNFSKRLIKSPKLYFTDTGLLCRLLNIRSADELVNHPFRGHLFENWCVLETLKATYNRGLRPSFYFWRDQSIEVDLLIQFSTSKLGAFECKSSATPLTEFLKPSLKFKSFAKGFDVSPGVVYGGDERQNRSDGKFIPWKDFSTLLAAKDWSREFF